MIDMPVVLRFGRFKFVIHPQDHSPAHVHVLADGAEAKFDIKSGNCIAVYGFSQRTINLLSEVVLENTDLLTEAWKDNEGQE